jgi:hypothetical protein
MGKRSVILLGDTENNVEFTGEAVRGDAYFGYKDGLHTVAIYLENFTGRVYIEATLANEPGDNDWFPINLTGNTDYIEYPLIPNMPTGLTGDTGVDAYSFQGNLMFLRARIDKTYITPIPTTPAEEALLGSIRKILLNH